MMMLMSRCLHNIQRFDLRMLLWFFHARRRELWITLARASSRSGDGWMQLALPSVIWMLDRAQGAVFFIATALAFCIERPLYWVLKNSLQRPRPPEAIPSFQSVVIASDRFSFPSGHTAAAFLLAGNTVLHYGALGAPLYLWACSVGLSRIALGVHFPTDILAGMVLGTGIACLVSNTNLFQSLMTFQ
jgi:undecaprenyl-diphosphatase